ncbi:MAG TPA: c-type cytochrome [Blastocatellia bacterium]|nr:c-type cytochrome [Blastocatellia bacterium]
MKKEYVGYGLIGIVAGLVIGFFVGNAMYPGTSASQQNVAASGGNLSVNGGPNQQLPPNHPTIEPGKTVPAGPLPPGASDAPAGETPAAAPGSNAGATSVSLPSLDPLPAGNKEERTEQKYKNIQMLKGLPAERLMKIMFAFKDSLGVDCTFCHIKDQFEKDDKPEKQTARKMIALVRDANAKIGAARVSCYTCHRGQQRPAQ